MGRGGKKIKCLQASLHSKTEPENLASAVKVFKDMVDLGLVAVPWKDNFTEGLDNLAFSFTFRDETRQGSVAVMDNINFTGATVFRGGAATFLYALDTVAHEIKHLDPYNIKLWTSGSGFKQKMAQEQGKRFGSQTVGNFIENSCKE